MESKRHQKLLEHYKAVLGEEPAFSLKLKKNVLPNDMKPITTLVFKPTDELPFWKLCTIGASDYLMPERDIGWGSKANPRNEYMMLISLEVEVDESKAEWLFLNSLLWSTAEYAFNKKEAITVSDTIDMGIKGKYCGTILLLPEAFKTPKIVKCYYSKHKYISVPGHADNEGVAIQKAQNNGIYWLMEYFYTHDDDYKLIASKPYATL